MNLTYNNTMTNPSAVDVPAEEEKFERLTKFTRSHSGGRTEIIEYIAATRGKANVRSWVKDYLSEGKEELYLRALRNLYRKLDFIELNQALEMEDISETEYVKELAVNEDNYLIPAPDGAPSVQQIIQITDIIRRIGREKKMSVDEVSEMFSLEMEKSLEVLNKGQ